LLETVEDSDTTKQPDARDVCKLEASRFPSLAFVDKEAFQGAIAVSIVVNTIVLGFEIDVPWYGWRRIEQLFVLIFVVELVLHVLYKGVSFFTETTWNMIDTCIVLLGVLETWVIPWFSMQTHASPAMALRCLRLLRLLRLLRFVRMFDRLQKFFVALIDMAPMLMWIFLILFLLCYVTAIVLTHMWGKFELLNEESMSHEDQEALKGYFGDLMTTMFTLFRILTMDSWHNIANLVTKYMPISRLFFVSFIAFGSWTMISLLTAVVSDFLITATSDLKELEAKRALEQKLAFCSYLRIAFRNADHDRNGLLDRSEFVRWAGSDVALKKLKQSGFDASTDELVSFFDLLDVDQSHTLSIDEFVDGFARAQESLGMKHMLMLEGAIKAVASKARSNSSDIKTLESFLRGPLMDRLDALSEKVQHVTQVQCTILEHLQESQPRSAVAQKGEKKVLGGVLGISR